MDGMIKVSTDKLRGTSSEFSSIGSTVSNLTSQMTSLVTGISGAVWTGEAATAYVSKFKSLDNDIQKINRKIQEHVNDLNEMARVFDEAENTNVQTSSGLPGSALS